MAEKQKFSDTLRAKIGSLMAHTSRKDKNVVTRWKEIVKESGAKPSDVLLGVMKFQLEQGGVNVSELREAEYGEEMNKALSQVQTARTVSQMANQLIADTAGREHEHMIQMSKIHENYQSEISQLRSQNHRLMEENARTNSELILYAPAIEEYKKSIQRARLAAFQQQNPIKPKPEPPKSVGNPLKSPREDLVKK